MSESRREVRNELSGSSLGQVVQVGSLHGDVHLQGQPGAPVPDEVKASDGFVNREDERARARELLDRPDLSKIVFTGLAGAGKTATACQVGSAADFPGGRIMVRLGQHRTEHGVPLSDLLAEVMRTLGVEKEAIPDTFERRAAHFTNVTSKQPCLLLLDDVVEPAEIDPFVPGATGSKVLVTSNRRLSDLLLTEEAVVEIGALPDEAGSELMQAMCGEHRAAREPAAMRELSELCGGFPAQLGVAARHLRREPSLAVAELVAEYRADGGERTAPFNVTYARLSPEAAQLYRRLGLLSLTCYGADLVAATSGRAHREARPILAELLEAGLVIDEGSRSYRMHELVAVHARTCAEQDESAAERTGVRRQVVAHYLRKTAWADLAVLGRARLRIGDPDLGSGENPFADKPSALRWLDGERATLLSVLRCAADAEHGGALDREAWQLAEAMTALYVNRRYLSEWVEATELGARAARRDGRPDAEARLRSFVSRAHTDLGRLDVAHAELATALPRAEQSGGTRLLASVWELIGRFRDAAPGFAGDRIGGGSAAEAYSRALELFDVAGDERGRAFVLVFLGSSQGAAGELDQALATLQEAHERCSAVPDARMAGRARTAIGRLQLDAGRHDEAIGTLTATADALDRDGDTYYAAEARESLAAAAAAAGDRQRSTESLRQVLDVHIRIGSPRVAELRAALGE